MPVSGAAEAGSFKGFDYLPEGGSTTTRLQDPALSAVYSLHLHRQGLLAAGEGVGVWGWGWGEARRSRVRIAGEGFRVWRWGWGWGRSNLSELGKGIGRVCGWMPIDAILSILVSLLILRSTISILHESFHFFDGRGSTAY